MPIKKQGFFEEARFFTTVNQPADFPHIAQEVAFVGRSNAGKSSSINALTGKKHLAYVSKTPGRTQHINYFQLKNGDFIVDLPGYGYAAVPTAIKKHWVKLLGNYLATRVPLVGLVMIMDCRHPLKELDQLMLDFFIPRQLPIHVLLSKADKLSRSQQLQTLLSVEKQLSPWRERGAAISAQLFSTSNNLDKASAEHIISSWFNNV